MLPVLASHIRSKNLILGTVCIKYRAAVVRDVTPCSLRGIYIHSGGTLPSCLGYLTNGDSTFLLSVIKFLTDCTVSHKKDSHFRSHRPESLKSKTPLLHYLYAHVCDEHHT